MGVVFSTSSCVTEGRGLRIPEVALIAYSTKTSSGIGYNDSSKVVLCISRYHKLLGPLRNRDDRCYITALLSWIVV